MMSSKTCECGAELVELPMEVFYLCGGELIGEGVKGLLRFLLSVKGSQARASETVHGDQKLKRHRLMPGGPS